MTAAEQWAIACGLTIIGLIVGATWKILTRINDVQEASQRVMAEHQKSDDAAFAAIRELMRLSDEELRRHTGETFIAMRQKITEVEMWSRDNLIRRESFLSIVEGLRDEYRAVRDDVKGFYARLDACFDKLEKKIDDVKK